MMKYVIEMDLIPTHMGRCSYPRTIRFLIEAEGISDAMEKVVADRAPGQDCVAVRVLEIGENV